MKTKIIFICILSALIIQICIGSFSFGWGFWAHQRINRLAVFTLPPELFTFYKNNIIYVTEHAVDPDSRRYMVEGEAPCHYIDLDIYGDSALAILPHNWHEAVEKFTIDTLMAYGIVPWNIMRYKNRLTKAFKEKDIVKILKISADIGHYIGDSHVPLHTTENYNGQKTNQYGIHGFWESRIPELFGDDFDLFTGQAKYLDNPREYIWEVVAQSHACLDSVFGFEKELTNKMPPDLKYSFEDRGNKTVKTYSKDFTLAYNEMLSGQVQRRMQQSIITVGSFWMTCWIDAGQPDLSDLADKKLTEAQIKALEDKPDQEGKTIEIINREE